jgi:hypothetical protein
MKSGLIDPDFDDDGFLASVVAYIDVHGAVPSGIVTNHDPYNGRDAYADTIRRYEAEDARDRRLDAIKRASPRWISDVAADERLRAIEYAEGLRRLR